VIWKQLLFWFLEWAAKKSADWLTERAAQAKRAEERANESRKELERLKNAKTEREVEDAAKDTLGL